MMPAKWRLASFMGGVFTIWVVMGSPLAAMDHQLLTVHMVQHLLLMTLAAPLILLGAPVPQRFVLQWPPMRAVIHIVTHPVFCWLASTTVVIGWHIPALFELGMQSEGWHMFEHATFFAAGILFWLPVIQPWLSVATWPRSRIPLYLFLATLPCDALSAFLTFCNRVVYSHYGSGHRLLDIVPLADQEWAGALMWVWVTFAYLAPAAVITIKMLSPQRQTTPALHGVR
jgi:putative membrane protein